MSLEALRSYLLALGFPGLLLVSFLDSAGVPLPGGVDLIVMLLSWQHPSWFWLVALLAAAGSAGGCFVLYRLARTGGDRMMARFSSEKQEWVKEKVRRNDLLAVTAAMLGPPPFPTKLFVVVAGVVRMNWRRFLGAVFLGRSIRFLGLGYVGMSLGDRGADTLRTHYPTIALSLVTGVAAFLLLRWLLGRKKS